MKFSIGGQNPFWDGVIAAAALAAQGKEVVYDLHTIDIFSRDASRKGISPALTRELYLPSGDYNRWTACLEHPSFLGRPALAPARFEDAGVNLDRIIAFTGLSREKLVAALTAGDWYGVSLGEDTRLAQGTPTGMLAGSVRQLAKHAFSGILADDTSRAYADELKSLFTFGIANDGPQGGRLWEEVGIRIAAHFLRMFGATTDTLTSFAITTARKERYSSVFHAFVRDYDSARDLYNEAICETEERVVPLAHGELPFFGLVREQGVLRREPIRYEPGDTADRIVDRLAGSDTEERQFLGISGKAIIFILELRCDFALATPEKGSPYLPATRFFAKEASRRIRGFPSLEPGYVVRLHALDALADVEGSFALPRYLARAFGTDLISCHDFAHAWQGYAEGADSAASLLVGREVPSLIPHLLDRGIVDSASYALVEPIFRSWLEFGSAMRAADASQKALLRLGNKHEFLRDLHKQALAGIDFLRAQALKDEWSVADGLRYWNCRPFALWIASFPGWMEAIKKRTECIPE